MKKFICLLLALTLVCALTACGSKKEEPAKETAQESSADHPAQDTAKNNLGSGTASERETEASDKVTLDSVAQVQDASEAAAMGEAFVGDWICEGTSLHIAQQGESFAIEIKNDGGLTWAYECKQVGSLLICNEAGVSKSASGETAYDDGTASFSIGSDGKLYWDDYKSFGGNGLAFVKQ